MKRVGFTLVEIKAQTGHTKVLEPFQRFVHKNCFRRCPKVSDGGLMSTSYCEGHEGQLHDLSSPAKRA